MDRLPTPLYLDRAPKLSWRISETVVELDDRPHLLLRIEIRGTSFPQLDSPPFVRIAGRREAFRSWFANVSDDGSSLAGYFGVDTPLPDGVLEYGYGNAVFGHADGFAPQRIERLDKARLPKTLVPVTEAFIAEKTGS